MNRRQFFLASATLAGLRAQTGDLPDMLLDYFTKRLDAAKPAVPLDSPALRRALREITGPYPPRTTLNARTVRSAPRNGYRVESVVFESRPDFYVTANLYVPDHVSARRPGIVMPRGHFDPDRMAGDYLQIAFDLVREGFVVLSYDPVGQGPRRQQWAEPGGQFDGLFSTSLEHALIGSKLALLGESSAGWQIRDAMSAVDYLLTRDEVDPKRIGCADHSDNGSESALFCAVDSRVSCAVLHSARFGHRRPPDRTTWIVVDDTQEYMPNAAAFGIDVCETFAALVPTPLLVLRENQDAGFAAAIDHLQERYRRAGRPEAFAVRTAGAEPDWPARLRMDTAAWFARWFGTGPAAGREADVAPGAGLREVCPGKSVHTLIREKSAAMRPPAVSAARLREIIKPIPAAGGPPLVLNSTESQGLRVDLIQIPSEPGIRLPARLVHPAVPNGKVVIYVAGDVTPLDAVTGDEDYQPPPPDRTPEAIAARGFRVLAVDVRGIGAMAPRIPRRGFRVPYQQLMNRDMAFNLMAWSLGDSLLAMRVRDVLRAVDAAGSLGEVHLAGRDMGAVWALFAAALDSRIRRVVTVNGLLSWRSMVENDRFLQASSQIHWGILQDLDLPQLAALTGSQRVTVLDPWDHDRKPVPAAAASAVYRAAGAEIRVRVGADLADEL